MKVGKHLRFEKGEVLEFFRSRARESRASFSTPFPTVAASANWSLKTRGRTIAACERGR